jgi:endonuclease/exonuclease/phosphatase family metal-dependent hydrolase
MTRRRTSRTRACFAAVQPLLRLLVSLLVLVGASACRSASMARGGHDATSAPAVTLRVMTYNIAAGGGDLARIEQTIRESGADVVALQEVDRHWDARSDFADQGDALAKALNMSVRFAPIYSLVKVGRPERAEFGVALLSRFPIVAFHNHDLTRLSTQTAGASPAPAPGFLDATIDIAGTRLRVFNTHLDYRADPAVRVRQVSEMLAIMAGSQGPTLLFGDLNATPDAAELQPLFRRLDDLWQAAAAAGGSAGLSYPALKPLKRIDYVLGSSGIRASSIRTIESIASDHRPVVADLVLIGR